MANPTLDVTVGGLLGFLNPFNTGSIFYSNPQNDALSTEGYYPRNLLFGIPGWFDIATPFTDSQNNALGLSASSSETKAGASPQRAQATADLVVAQADGANSGNLLTTQVSDAVDAALGTGLGTGLGSSASSWLTIGVLLVGVILLITLVKR